MPSIALSWASEGTFMHPVATRAPVTDRAIPYPPVCKPYARQHHDEPHTTTWTITAIIDNDASPNYACRSTKCKPQYRPNYLTLTIICGRGGIWMPIQPSHDNDELDDDNDNDDNDERDRERVWLWETVEGAGEWGRVGRVEQDGRRMIGAPMANQDDGAHAFWNIDGGPKDSASMPGTMGIQAPQHPPLPTSSLLNIELPLPALLTYAPHTRAYPIR
ncbi:hypothetical protein EV421DRAFT_1742100 [Armillaria borealis]|uniref:Uncharacterized protein n=1 Tax=Armillaria borealis TaxID=47425 RepID=A0AA39IY98_9AGAR|nr:hypothetical protein EV421DRAFT_1742100 [Armillaria borealis]